jgi:MFS family permease
MGNLRPKNAGGAANGSLINPGPKPYDRQARLQSVDGAAGGALHPFVHRPSLRLQRLQSADEQADRYHQIGAGRLETHRSRVDLLDRHFLSWRVGGGVRALGRGGRAAPRYVHGGVVLQGGFLISAVGVSIHQLWLIYLGYGVLGGTGLGLGYISPVSTLIKWFPDRPGMATGMAIMGFGGGAMIASPLSVWLMSVLSTPTHVGVAETFVVLGLVYAVFMLVGATIVRVPPPGWKPAN